MQPKCVSDLRESVSLRDCFLISEPSASNGDASISLTITNERSLLTNFQQHVDRFVACVSEGKSAARAARAMTLEAAESDVNGVLGIWPLQRRHG